MDQSPLEYLLGTFFHQDTDVLYGDEWGAVDHFIEADSHLAVRVPAEIDALLQTYQTEGELKEYVDGARAEFLPVDYEGGYREWLALIAQRCREGIAGVERRKQERGPFPGTRPPRHASTFPDHDTAEEAIGQVLDANLAAFEDWLENGADQRIVFRGVADRVIGRSMDGATYKAIDVNAVHVVILRSDSNPDGWAVHTAYPIAEPPRTDLDTPALAHLMGGYFHQDWDSDYPDQAAAVADFVAGSPTWAPRIGPEIDALLGSNPSEKDLADHLLALGCEFTIKPGTETYGAWLTDVASRVTALV